MLYQRKQGKDCFRWLKMYFVRDEFQDQTRFGESFEPNWIQFKFSAKEFDVNKLDKLTKESGIITEEIINIYKL